MGFVLIAYYTKNSIYEESAKLLLDAAKGLGMRTDFMGINDRGNWGKNTEYKPFFVRDMLKKWDGFDIAYTDADSMIHEYPALFDETDAEMLVRKQDFPWRKNEFMSGTFFMRNCDNCKRAVNAWINKVRSGKTLRNRPETWEQAHMGKAIVESGLDYRQLPHSYIYYDHIERVEGKVDKPVITHMQYSRKLK